MKEESIGRFEMGSANQQSRDSPITHARNKPQQTGNPTTRARTGSNRITAQPTHHAGGLVSTGDLVSVALGACCQPG